MLGSLLVALWGFWRGLRAHRQAGPLLLGIAGAVSLASGVIIVHGFPAMQNDLWWGHRARRRDALEPSGAARID